MSENTNKRTVVVPTYVLCHLLDQFSNLAEFIDFAEAFEMTIMNYVEVKRSITLKTGDDDITIENKLAMARCVFIIASFVRENMDLLQSLIRLLDYKVVDQGATINGESIIDKVQKKDLSPDEYRQL